MDTPIQDKHTADNVILRDRRVPLQIKTQLTSNSQFIFWLLPVKVKQQLFIIKLV